MYAPICYDSLPNCRRGGDLSVGVSVSTHVGLGSGNKLAGLSELTCKERPIRLETCSRMSTCMYICVSVAVCMNNVCTHVMTVYLM